MTLFVAWVVFPLLLGLVSLGCGLLLQRIAGRPLPGPVLLSAGVALVIVAGSFTTWFDLTARLTTPLVVVLALVGFALSRDYRPRFDGWAGGSALATFAVYAAPIVLTGTATIAGYISLDDTSTWLALGDQALSHGRDLASLAPSTYSAVLHDDIPNGYPLGAMLPFSIGHELTGSDAAWLFQPSLAFLAALLGASVYSMTDGLIERRPLRALTAFVGAQPALLYAYSLWSGVKEVTVAALLAGCAALAIALVRGERDLRSMVPLAVGGAAVLDALTGIGVVWFGGFALFAVLVLLARGTRPGLAALGVLVGLLTLLSLPALWITSAFVNSATSGSYVAAGDALNNLIRPLSALQIVGIWPAGDFRISPHEMDVTYVLLAVTLIGAAIGFGHAVRERRWGVPLYGAVAIGGAFTVVGLAKVGHGSPWLDAKALATGSPALVVAGLTGGAILFETGRRLESVVLLSAIVIGVGWSNLLAYEQVPLAPQAQFAELSWIGDHFAGDGPTLMTEFQPYGVRHFLRRLDGEGAAERRYRSDYLQSGATLAKGEYADVDAFQLGSILVYRTLVLRTSALESRPPGPYKLVWQGKWYEVWQRSAKLEPLVYEHLSLENGTEPTAVPTCEQVQGVAATATKVGGVVVASELPPTVTADFSASALPNGWSAFSSEQLLPVGSGTVEVTVTVPVAGRYGLWLGGSQQDPIAISVDGRKVGVADALENTAQLTPVGSIALGAGSHLVTLHDDGPGLAPGTHATQTGIGPLVLGSSSAAAKLVSVAPSQASSLCGRALDWIEADSAPPS